AAGGSHAIRWTAAGGMQDLGSLSPTGNSIARAVNGDGSVVVGEGNSVAGAILAWRWTAATGMQDLNTYLPTVGVNLAGWVLEEATGISASGKTIVGRGDHNGQVQVWIVSLGDESPCGGRPGGLDYDCDGRMTPSDIAIYLVVWLDSLAH